MAEMPDNQSAICCATIPLLPETEVVNALWQITSPYFCAGVVLRNGRVIDAPPILHYMASNSWGEEQISEYCRKKGWCIAAILPGV